jgi:hypothetical protein
MKQGLRILTRDADEQMSKIEKYLSEKREIFATDEEIALHIGLNIGDLPD